MHFFCFVGAELFRSRPLSAVRHRLGGRREPLFCCEGNPAFVVSVNCYFMIISPFCFCSLPRLPPSLPVKFPQREIMNFASVAFVYKCCRFFPFLPPYFPVPPPHCPLLVLSLPSLPLPTTFLPSPPCPSSPRSFPLPPSAVTQPVFCYVGCMLPVLGLLKCVALFITL